MENSVELRGTDLDTPYFSLQKVKENEESPPLLDLTKEHQIFSRRGGRKFMEDFPFPLPVFQQLETLLRDDSPSAWKLFSFPNFSSTLSTKSAFWRPLGAAATAPEIDTAYIFSIKLCAASSGCLEGGELWSGAFAFVANLHRIFLARVKKGKVLFLREISYTSSEGPFHFENGASVLVRGKRREKTLFLRSGGCDLIAWDFATMTPLEESLTLRLASPLLAKGRLIEDPRGEVVIYCQGRFSRLGMERVGSAEKGETRPSFVLLFSENKEFVTVGDVFLEKNSGNIYHFFPLLRTFHIAVLSPDFTSIFHAKLRNIDFSWVKITECGNVFIYLGSPAEGNFSYRLETKERQVLD